MSESDQEQSDDLAEDFAYVRTVFDELANALVRFGRPMPRSVVRAREILDRALTSAMSLQRRGIGSEEQEYDSSNIGTDEAAELLKVTRRTVQRNAEALGGRQVSGAWVFDREAIGANLDG